MSRLERGKMIVLLYVCRYSYRKVVTISLNSNSPSGSDHRQQSCKPSECLLNCQAAPATSPLPKLSFHILPQ